MIKSLAIWIAIIALAIATGVGAALLMTRTEYFGNQRAAYGAWSVSRLNSAFEDPLTIARIAGFGPFPVRPSEVMYVTALEDSSGRLLGAGSRYTVCGRRFDARFWSITAYDGNGMFFPNPDQRFSFNHQNINFDGDRFCLNVGPERQAVNWLPATGQGRMRLMIRFCQPSPALRDSLSAETLPVIQVVTQTAGGRP